MMSGNGWTGMIIVFGLVCAVAGWCAIEGLRWIFSFIHISFG
ncbi:hypothetical protein AH04_18 [Erwinia phage AH04]|uniref:Uncharacterized protein n=1 Tax=Erwinia phage AH04 TaxID=2869569 RepID=A0AAE8BQ95_9CAUD|nr:hypothetical protein PQC02_gp018 [Erwinia phage AH04]QZA70783.1 hypothetical protein AH04_18 [Erwinia phage AH04]